MSYIRFTSFLRTETLFAKDEVCVSLGADPQTAAHLMEKMSAGHTLFARQMKPDLPALGAPGTPVPSETDPKSEKEGRKDEKKKKGKDKDKDKEKDKDKDKDGQDGTEDQKKPKGGKKKVEKAFAAR